MAVTALTRSAALLAAASVVLVACGSDDDPAAETTPAATTPATDATSTTDVAATTTAPSTTLAATTTTTIPATTTTATTAPPTTTTTTTTVPAAASVRYRVTLVMEWSPDTHPATLPPGWHSSPAVLAAHAAAGDVVPVGGIASPGVESMAETGMTALLVEEFVANPAVGEFATGQRIDEVGTDVLEVTATQSTPFVSLVTMLAPSPDWFVGVLDLAVFVNGSWLERAELDLVPYDAGTDSGPGFTSDDADTQPRMAIAVPSDPDYVASAAEGRFGHVVIERIG